MFSIATKIVWVLYVVPSITTKLITMLYVVSSIATQMVVIGGTFYYHQNEFSVAKNGVAAIVL